jgi:monoamine oxidase
MEASVGQSRRQFLERFAGVAGAAATYDAMVAIGLMGMPRQAAAFSLQGSGTGTRVVVLGGGLAGLSTAYELRKLGYDVTVLEARMRPGGRCHTVKKGTTSEEDGSAASQVCAFDDGQYFNPGPMRIPHHHASTLGYCRELDVPVEVLTSDDNEAAYVHQRGSATAPGRKLRAREVKADLSGYIAELLAKAVGAPGLLDARMTAADEEALIEYLNRAGALTSRKYSGGTRRGYQDAPGYGTKSGAASTPIPLSDLIQSRAGTSVLVEYLHQNPMFQVVGGQSGLPSAFAAKLGDRVIYGAEVQEIKQSATGVDIAYVKDGQPQTVTAQYGVYAMPLNMMAGLKVADFRPELKTAIGAITYASSGKIGMQFKRRFWEEDDGIYGGITKTDMEIANIIYPSSGYLRKKGVIVGYYQSGTRAEDTGKKPHKDREALALEQGLLIHPQYKAEFENSFSVSWQHVKYSKGAWAQIGPAHRKGVYLELLKADRRMYFAGDHCSYLVAWMAGALESGREVATAIHTRATQDVRSSAGAA